MATKTLWALPKEMKVEPDSLELKLEFYRQSIVMHCYEDNKPTTVRLVDARDITAALAKEMNFCSGLLPPNTLFWRNAARGTVTAIYQEPKKRKIALQSDFDKPPVRFTLPLPGFIFLCIAGQSPWVYAVKRRPTKESDLVYHPPLSNVFDSGRSCPGSQKYPANPLEIIDGFFISFFSKSEADKKSRRHPKDITQLWPELDGQAEFPLDDLIQQCTLKDLMTMPMERY
jgi:hypothetical protein